MIKEECGLVGVAYHKEAANLSYLALYALQHRGQDAFGLASLSSVSEEHHLHKKAGLVADRVKESDLKKLSGDISIGHVRYSTHGDSSSENIQPFSFNLPGFGRIYIAHNGNLTNAEILKKELEEAGSIFNSSSDSEIFMHLLARSKKPNLERKIADVVTKVKGAYCLLIASSAGIIAVRDSFGFRPLVLGKKDETYICASETCALDLLDARFVRKIRPGEIVSLKKNSCDSWFPENPKEQEHFCSFEPIYFSRPDSLYKTTSYYNLRQQMGKVLAQESPADADIVVPVPDSGVALSLGFSQESKTPFEFALIRNHYVGRTFIEPSQAIRDFGVKIKLNPVSSLLRDRKVVVIDDSIVRGTTSVKIVRMLRNAGAREIHFRVGCPPITHSCFYGVSTPSRDHLLAAQKKVKDIEQMLEVDSLAYLSLEGLKQALGDYKKSNHCYACFNGNYPENICRKVLPAPTDTPL
jgi:amidophosphoribosyltransferase